jgi:TonB family protein
MLTFSSIALSLVISAGLAASRPQQPPPRDPVVTSASVPQTPAAREVELRSRVAAGPVPLDVYFELSKLQENRGAYDEAEATLVRAREIDPASTKVLQVLAGFYNRQGQFEKTIATLEAGARLEPTNPAVHQLVAVFYWEKASKDKQLAAAQKWTYLFEGIAATDRALSVNPEYVEALTYKNILLRMRANMETDPVQQQKTVAEADALRSRAMELNKVRAGVSPSPSLIASTGQAIPVAASVQPGSAPVRVGGNIKPPAKTRHVPPVYPPEAYQNRISGVVILEASIGTDGRVYDARVLKSILLLDQAAIEAVRQWEFEPTLLNGAPVPVIMTVTVNFTLQ